MSMPPLRQPKNQAELPSLRQPKNLDLNKSKNVHNDQQFIILTLSNKKKIVIQSDFFHCINCVGEYFNCVVCNTKIVAEVHLKDNHKKSAEHQTMLKTYPFLESLAENLVRQIGDNWYCTICNIVTPIMLLHRHIHSEHHQEEISKAILRADFYKPTDYYVNPI